MSPSLPSNPGPSIGLHCCLFSECAQQGRPRGFPCECGGGGGGCRLQQRQLPSKVCRVHPRPLHCTGRWLLMQPWGISPGCTHADICTTCSWCQPKYSMADVKEEASYMLVKSNTEIVLHLKVSVQSQYSCRCSPQRPSLITMHTCRICVSFRTVHPGASPSSGKIAVQVSTYTAHTMRSSGREGVGLMMACGGWVGLADRPDAGRRLDGL